MKKRVLVPIVGQGSIIHIIRTGMLLQLRDFCQPVVALLWQQPDLASELEALGFEVYIIPPYSVSGQYKLVRSQINYWYQCFLLKTPSTGIQKKYLSKFRPGSIVLKQKIKEKLLWLKLKFNQQYINKLVKQEDALLLKEQVYKDYRTWVTSLKIEAIFTVTPFLHEVELIARILRKNSAHLIASIHSFDNVTKRGWPAIFFDDYFVWNKYNKAELERINPALTGHNKITIAGAPQFDFHYNDNYCWSKDQWLERLGLPGNKKIILYSGGSANLIPHEHQYVKDIINALEEGKIAGDAILLFRCHPLDAIQRWLDAIGNSSF
ncbi:MAG TPA: hypothetical protein VHB48_08580, partial [Chitinophagaceae bacterium]|nr:hypothetical protein [Chitinophagaceae bacterium]